MNWFKAVHQGLANSFFDAVLPHVRNKYTWIPLYLIIIALSIYKYKWRSIIFILMLVLTVVVADQFSANLIKDWAQRIRPCNEPLLQNIIRPLVDCGSGYSFISAHATNHFAIAVFFSWFFNTHYKWNAYRYLFYFWAGAIAFSQIYVGVHYPFDVIVGMFAGLTIGTILLSIYKLTLKN